jgi:hypothetical protein
VAVQFARLGGPHPAEPSLRGSRLAYHVVPPPRTAARLAPGLGKLARCKRLQQQRRRAFADSASSFARADGSQPAITTTTDDSGQSARRSKINSSPERRGIATSAPWTSNYKVPARPGAVFPFGACITAWQIAVGASPTTVVAKALSSANRLCRPPLIVTIRPLLLYRLWCRYQGSARDVPVMA